MRLLSALAVLAMLSAASCSETYLPTAPAAPPEQPPRTTSSFVGNIMDVHTHRACIENAWAEIIAGPSPGTVYRQDRPQCDDPGSGFIIKDLPIDSVLRLRASAPGYTSVERDFVVVRSGPSIDINLKRAETTTSP